MKRIQTNLRQQLLMFFVLTGCSFSCNDLSLNDESISPSGNEFQMAATVAALPPMPDMTQYRQITSASLARNLQNSDTYMLKFRYRLKTEYYYYNYERAIREEAMALNTNFGFQNFDFRQFSHFQINFAAYTGIPTLPSQISGTSDIYTPEQLQILNAYSSEMYNAQGTTDASLYYAYGRNMVQNSHSLSSEQKYVVLAFIETGNEFAKKYFAGQWQGVKSDVGATLNQSTSGCSVNWKSVWQGAVISAAAGAVSGAYVGATGGTVVLPFFGTVTGGVGGAVFGGAAGFAGGAAAGIAQELIFGCLFKTQTTQPDLTCNDIQYALNHSDCIQEIIDNKFWAKISG